MDADYWIKMEESKKRQNEAFAWGFGLGATGMLVILIVGLVWFP